MSQTFPAHFESGASRPSSESSFEMIGHDDVCDNNANNVASKQARAETTNVETESTESHSPKSVTVEAVDDVSEDIQVPPQPSWSITSEEILAAYGTEGAKLILLQKQKARYGGDEDLYNKLLDLLERYRRGDVAFEQVDVLISDDLKDEFCRLYGVAQHAAAVADDFEKVDIEDDEEHAVAVASTRAQHDAASSVVSLQDLASVDGLAAVRAEPASLHSRSGSVRSMSSRTPSLQSTASSERHSEQHSLPPLQGGTGESDLRLLPSTPPEHSVAGRDVVQESKAPSLAPSMADAHSVRSMSDKYSVHSMASKHSGAASVRSMGSAHSVHSMSSHGSISIQSMSSARTADSRSHDTEPPLLASMASSVHSIPPLHATSDGNVNILPEAVMVDDGTDGDVRNLFGDGLSLRYGNAVMAPVAYAVDEVGSTACDYYNADSKPPSVQVDGDAAGEIEYSTDDDEEYAARTVPQVARRVTSHALNVALVGAARSGKTTLAACLFMPLLKSCGVAVKDVARDASWSLFDAHAARTQVAVMNDEARCELHYSIQDTPALDSRDDAHRAAVLRFVQQRYHDYYLQESDLSKPREELEDNRVHAVLYVLPPQHVSREDLTLMQDLSRVTAVLPVIAKSDSLTMNEKEDICSALRGYFADAACGSVPYNFDDAALNAAGVRRIVPPFAVVASAEVDETVHSFWPVRRYSWGTVEAMRERDSDMKYLRKLLLEHGFWALRDATDARYRAYVRTITPSTPAALRVPVPASVPATVDAAIQSSFASMLRADATQGLLGPGYGGSAAAVDSFVERDFERITVKYAKSITSSTHHTTRDDKSGFRVMIQSEDRPLAIAIRVGAAEGSCIAAALESPGTAMASTGYAGGLPARPSYYDSMFKFLQHANLRVSRACITRIHDQVFMSSVALVGDGDGAFKMELDARPSDAINLAMCFNAPLYIRKSILDRHGKIRPH